jgi:ferredoxin/flavodoxin---NADP+ reductase
VPYVITRSCCSDASCVLACPVNCIHPAPGEPGFADAEMLYVDPAGCVDCGACVTACPVEAVKPHTKLAEWEAPFQELNARYFAEHPHADRPPVHPVAPAPGSDGARFTVAVVGSGPAGMYAADELLKRRGTTVDVYERLELPYGLVRFGVAPDHAATKQVMRLFDTIAAQPGFSWRLGVEVGRDVVLDDLRAQYDAVVLAGGAATDRRLGIPGETLRGVHSATDFVAWYSGHPEHGGDQYDLDRERVVVIGNGNVALDVARYCALRGVPEVVVLGRRGPERASFTTPELIGLEALPTEVRSRIELRYHCVPLRFLGTEDVTAVETTTGTIETGFVLRAIGYEPTAQQHHRGRIEPGLYVVGWAKRGPNGYIGTNRSCAAETVATMLADRGALLTV